MFLHIIFLYCISVTAANSDIFTAFRNKEAGGYLPADGKNQRSSPVYTGQDLTCDQMASTTLTPFVVILLLKTSGRYVGMGSIIDKATILTGAAAVEPATADPTELLVLAGRLSPWWGKDSQVQPVKELYVHNEAQMALLKLLRPFRYTKNVKPIKILLKDVPDFEPDYDKHYAVFGVPRSTFDVPGEPTPKSSIYTTKIETMMIKKPDLDPCKFHFPDSNYYGEIHICTTANGTYCWGCIGSPTVALTKGGHLLQIAVISKVSVQEKDLFHRHTKVGPFIAWIRSQSFINYNVEDLDI